MFRRKKRYTIGYIILLTYIGGPGNGGLGLREYWASILWLHHGPRPVLYFWQPLIIYNTVQCSKISLNRLCEGILKNSTTENQQRKEGGVRLELGLRFTCDQPRKTGSWVAPKAIKRSIQRELKKATEGVKADFTPFIFPRRQEVHQRRKGQGPRVAWWEAMLSYQNSSKNQKEERWQSKNIFYRNHQNWQQK